MDLAMEIFYAPVRRSLRIAAGWLRLCFPALPDPSLEFHPAETGGDPARTIVCVKSENRPVLIVFRKAGAQAEALRLREERGIGVADLGITETLDIQPFVAKASASAKAMADKMEGGRRILNLEWGREEKGCGLLEFQIGYWKFQTRGGEGAEPATRRGVRTRRGREMSVEGVLRGGAQNYTSVFAPLQRDKLSAYPGPGTSGS